MRLSILIAGLIVSTAALPASAQITTFVNPTGIGGYTIIRPAFAECVTVKYRDTPVCIDTFDCRDTPQSSFVRRVCYDGKKSYMVIKLNEVWYHYCAVDRAAFDDLVSAASIGSAYNQNFRSHVGVHGPFDCRDHPAPDYH